MKIVKITILLIGLVSIKVNAQEKTIDKILDNTKGVLDILNNRKQTKQETLKKNEEVIKENPIVKSNLIGKFLVTNSSLKRVSISIKLISNTKEFTKQFVLSAGDKEVFKNLENGTYEYVAKFEDGIIAKSGEFEITDEIKSIEKDIK
jgi:adenylosuccinate synthase